MLDVLCVLLRAAGARAWVDDDALLDAFEEAAAAAEAVLVPGMGVKPNIDNSGFVGL